MAKISSYLWHWVAQVVNMLATCVHLLHYQRHCLSNCVIILDIYCSIHKSCNWEMRYVVFRFNRVPAWVNSYIEGMITHKWKRFPQVCEHHTKRVTLGVRHARGGAVVLEENHGNVLVISKILSTYRIFFWTWSWQRPLSTICPALHML